METAQNWRMLQRADEDIKTVIITPKVRWRQERCEKTQTELPKDDNVWGEKYAGCRPSGRCGGRGEPADGEATERGRVTTRRGKRVKGSMSSEASKGRSRRDATAHSRKSQAV